MSIRTFIQRIAHGQPINAAWANQVAAALNGLIGFRGDGATIAVAESKGVYTFKLIAPLGSGAPPQLMRFKSHSANGDYLVCRSWDGTNEGGTDIFVAKSYLLRRTPFDTLTYNINTYNGYTYTYSSAYLRSSVFIYNGNSITLPEKITPDFVADDLIYAVSAVTLVNDASGNPVTLLDMNVDARAWGDTTS